MFDGEWIIAAWVGRSLVALAFTSAIVAGISYFSGWKDLEEKLLHSRSLSIQCYFTDVHTILCPQI